MCTRCTFYGYSQTISIFVCESDFFFFASLFISFQFYTNHNAVRSRPIVVARVTVIVFLDNFQNSLSFIYSSVYDFCYYIVRFVLSLIGRFCCHNSLLYPFQFLRNGLCRGIKNEKKTNITRTNTQKEREICIDEKTALSNLLSFFLLCWLMCVGLPMCVVAIYAQYLVYSLDRKKKEKKCNDCILYQPNRSHSANIGFLWLWTR